MCSVSNIPERRKTPPLRGSLVKWEYTNTVSKITLSVCLADAGIVRVTYFPGAVPEDEPSYAVSPGYSAPGAEIREYDEDGVHVVETSLLRIRIRTEEQKVDFYDVATDEPLLTDEGGFGRESKDWTGDARVWIRKNLQETEHFFGLGDKPCALNLRGKYFSMWGADHYDFHEESDPLYKSIPFFLSLRERKAYGLLFDNTCRSYFDFGATDEKVLSFGSFGGLMNYYFIYGRTPLDIISAYTRLTGTPELPPLWALGYHQSKWSYYPDKAVYNLVERFRGLGIPCDAVHLDHHYMERKEGFTWDKQNFPDAEGMVRSLEKDGVKTVLIVNPGVKVNPANPVWKEGMERNYFCRRSEGNLLSEEVWPGLCNFPDFTAPAVRGWWADLFSRDIGKIGVRGLWNDMNEPVVFPDRTFPMDTRHEYDGMPCSHEKAHNIYGQCMAEASWLGMKRHAPDRRPFLLSRSGFAGLQRFAATWTGDNRVQLGTFEAGQFPVPAACGFRHLLCGSGCWGIHGASHAGIVLPLDADGLFPRFFPQSFLRGVRRSGAMVFWAGSHLLRESRHRGPLPPASLYLHAVPPVRGDGHARAALPGPAMFYQQGHLLAGGVVFLRRPSVRHSHS